MCAVIPRASCQGGPHVPAPRWIPPLEPAARALSAECVRYAALRRCITRPAKAIAAVAGRPGTTPPWTREKDRPCRGADRITGSGANCLPPGSTNRKPWPCASGLTGRAFPCPLTCAARRWTRRRRAQHAGRRSTTRWLPVCLASSAALPMNSAGRRRPAT